MVQTMHEALTTATLLYVRANSTSTDNPVAQTRPPIYKAIGIALAIASGNFIGVSFVLKKIGLLKANDEFGEAAGEGYGYLKNSYWWAGMILMIIGEVCNFVAYAFVDAILVTPLGALSVVITTILSAIFLKERLSMVGKVGCFLCIVGSVVIVMNAPAESSVANIQEMQNFVIAPGFLAYAAVLIIGCASIAIWVAPRYGKKSMMVYLSICSLTGGLSVVATQGLGAAIVAQIGGTPQLKHWFLYALFIFVIATLFTEIIYLNKALNIFNAALVTPTYYVFFTSSTIITSAILFRGFEGSVTSIVTVVNGFLVICAGVSLLQLSKSAKDVPDATVFTGDLDQVRTIAEQEQPESEPKADAIRGAAAIVRKISSARQKWELDEAKRLHEEKKQDLRAIGESDEGNVHWDGLRRRTTPRSVRLRSSRQATRESTVMTTPSQHPPLGMSQFPPELDSDHDGEVPETGGIASSIFGSILYRRKTSNESYPRRNTDLQLQAPTQIVPLTEISIPRSPVSDSHEMASRTESRQNKNKHSGLNPALKPENLKFDQVSTEIRGTSNSNSPELLSQPTKRQFSFQTIFRKVSNNTIQSHPEDQAIMRPLSALKTSGIRRGSTSTVKCADFEEESLIPAHSPYVEEKSSPSTFHDEASHHDETSHAEEKYTGSHDNILLTGGDTEEICNTLEDISEEDQYEIHRNKWKATHDQQNRKL